jgi:hypothetical protein
VPGPRVSAQTHCCPKFGPRMGVSSPPDTFGSARWELFFRPLCPVEQKRTRGVRLGRPARDALTATFHLVANRSCRCLSWTRLLRRVQLRIPQVLSLSGYILFNRNPTEKFCNDVHLSPAVSMLTNMNMWSGLLV